VTTSITENCCCWKEIKTDWAFHDAKAASSKASRTTPFGSESWNTKTPKAANAEPVKLQGRLVQ
jgi:hypothetical protein